MSPVSCGWSRLALTVVGVVIAMGYAVSVALHTALGVAGAL